MSSEKEDTETIKTKGVKVLNDLSVSANSSRFIMNKRENTQMNRYKMKLLILRILMKDYEHFFDV